MNPVADVVALTLPRLPDAVCAQADPDLWFDERDAAHRTAVALCRTCPERLGCLEFALRTPVFGVWGGTTTDDRKRLARAGGRAYNPVASTRVSRPRSGGAA